MPSVMWSNGQVDTAKTWEELEDRVRHDQWWAYGPSEFRVEMQKRCLRWSGVEILTTGSSRQFFNELERAKVVTQVPDGYDEKKGQ